MLLLQDRVLGIINLIMDELLGDDRACRAFRAKFPEEVLQESLAGQLWFGAECLSAGSAILNREAESAEMRPLAKAVSDRMSIEVSVSQFSHKCKFRPFTGDQIVGQRTKSAERPVPTQQHPQLDRSQARYTRSVDRKSV